LTPYVELHARSAFSFLQGGSLPEEYAETAAKLGIGAMALLDRDGVYGSPRFFASMKKHGLKGHTGAEVRCTDGGYYPLLVKNRKGYQNLCRLITKTKLRTAKHPKPGQEAAATPDEIAEFAEGLMCFTGDGDGPLPLRSASRKAASVWKDCRPALARAMFMRRFSAIATVMKTREIMLSSRSLEVCSFPL
jgi:error-prone DNA polymerase